MLPFVFCRKAEREKIMPNNKESNRVEKLTNELSECIRAGNLSRAEEISKEMAGFLTYKERVLQVNLAILSAKKPLKPL